MKRPAAPGQQRSTGIVASEGLAVSTPSWQGASVTSRGAAWTTSIRVPSLRNRSAKVPGSRRSRSLAARSPSSSSRSSPSAQAIRSADPNALTSTGMSNPSTRSNSSATFRSEGPLETRSVISVISRSGETGTVTRCRRPCWSRWSTNSRRSRQAMAQRFTRSVGVEDGDQPTSQDRKHQARDDTHDDEVPAHEWCFPRDDALDAEERPRGHVGDQRRQGHAGVGECDHERHADHRPPGRQHAGQGGDDDGPEPALASEVTGHRLLRHQDLKQAGQEHRRDEAGQDDPEHREAVVGPDPRQPRIFEIRDDGERGGKDEQDDRRGIQRSSHRGSFDGISAADIIAQGFAETRMRCAAGRRGQDSWRSGRGRQIAPAQVVEDVRPVHGLGEDGVRARLPGAGDVRLAVPVMTRTRVRLVDPARIWRMSRSPGMSGSPRSVRTTSNSRWPTRSTASRPLPVATTSAPSARRRMVRTSRMSGTSSTRSTRIVRRARGRCAATGKPPPEDGQQGRCQSVYTFKPMRRFLGVAWAALTGRGSASDVPHEATATPLPLPGGDVLTSLVDTMDDALVVVDADLNVVHWNAAVERLTGLARVDARGRNLRRLVPVLDAIAFPQYLRRALSSEVTFTAQVAPEAWVQARCVPLRDAAGRVTGAAGFLTDMTERKRRAVFVRALEAIGRSLTSSLDLNEVLDTIVDKALEVMGADSALVVSWDGQAPEFRVMRAAGRLSDRYTAAGAIPIGGGPVSRAVLESRPLATPNILQDPQLWVTPERRAQIEQEGFRAVAAAPLASKGRVHGALVVHYWAERTVDEDELMALTRLAEQAALAIDNVRLYADATRRAERFRELAEVERLVAAPLGPDDVLRRIAEATARLVGAPVVHLWTAEPGARLLRLRAWSVQTNLPDVHMPATLAFGEGITGVAAERGEPVFVPDAGQDPRVRLLGWWREAGLGTILAVPILAGETLLGVLTARARPGARAARRDQARDTSPAGPPG